MIHIFFDIENTIIDDLWNCNFLQDRCNKITRWLHSRFSFVPRGRLKCHLFTWGWKECSEIEQKIIKKNYLIDWKFQKLIGVLSGQKTILFSVLLNMNGLILLMK